MMAKFEIPRDLNALPMDEDFDLDDDVTCDGCGRDLNGVDGDPCPLCCSHTYAPGSEECDWCRYSDECYEIYYGE